MKAKRAFLSLYLLMALAACTKERPYEELLKENVYSKELVDAQSEYLYVPSVLESTRTSTASRPQWMGDAKLVKLSFSEKSLDVVEVELDERFKGNPTNNRPVLSIPVEHVDYKCKENSLGECERKEEKNERIGWNERTRFKADFGAMTVKEINILPISIRNLFSMGICYSETSAKVVSATLEPDAINIQVERTYTAALPCAEEIESLSDLSFSVIHHYSLAKASAIASPGYAAVVYPEKDQNIFGFFTTELSKLSDDNRDRVRGLKTFMNRWSPARKEVVYYLSDSFANPENEKVRFATYAGVEAVNNALEKSGAEFRLVLKEPAGKSPGDIRNSMIVMVEDPLALGMLGYGPSVANPRTGEIVSARTVMYLGIVKRTIRNVYEELRKRLAEAKRAETKSKDGTSLAGILSNLASAPSSEPAPESKPSSGEALPPDTPAEEQPSAVAASALAPVRENPLEFRPSDLKAVQKVVSDYRLNAKAPEDLQEKLEAASRHCVYLADQVNFLDAVSKGVKAKVGEGELRPWEDLSDSERKDLLDLLVPYIWMPMRVHELGHNLGLRHNFQGSEDKANYYTKDELAKIGIDVEVPYSSVMDYSARTLNELRTMGKYDIAALRFAYQRKVELSDGSLVEVPDTLLNLEKKLEKDEKSLKEYGFCTDEHVGLNAGCKRFDEGTTLTEIAKYQISSYEERYQWRNMRNGARSFSIMSDGSYVDQIDDVFFNLRLMLEVHERVRTRFRITEEQWKTIPFLKDLEEAASVSANFLMKVLAMPDVHCAVLPVKDKNPKAMIVPLSMISADAISCFEPDLMDGLAGRGFQIIAQGGKLFQSRKAKDNPNPYADQIDVRGIWADKLLAAKYLFARRLGITNLDGVADNYLDFKGMSKDVKALAQSILNNRLSSKVTFTALDGEMVDVPLSYKLDVSTAQMIQLPIRSVRRALNLPETDTLLAKEVVSTMARELPHVQHTSDSAIFLDAFTVFTRIPDDGRALKDFKVLNVGTRRFLALPQNELASQAIEYTDAITILEKVKPEKIEEILKDLKDASSATQPAPPKETPEEKAVRKVKVSIIEDYLNERLETKNYYETLVSSVLIKI